MASDDGKRDLLSPLGGLSESAKAKRKAEADAFSAGMASIDLEALSLADDPGPTNAEPPAASSAAPKPAPAPAPRPAPEPEPKAAPQYEVEDDHTIPESIDITPPLLAGAPPASGLSLEIAKEAVEVARPAEPASANLEPVPDDAHPPGNRRVPTSPHLALDSSAGPGVAAMAAAAARSPSPAPSGRRVLFVSDPLTNLLIGAALGLAVMMIPARQIAERYEKQHVAPLITDLEGALDHPLGVEAGLVEKPRSIAGRIEEGRKKTRKRFFAVWILIGAPLGLGASQIPRVPSD